MEFDLLPLAHAYRSNVKTLCSKIINDDLLVNTSSLKKLTEKMIKTINILTDLLILNNNTV